MTDEQIIKALEYCAADDGDDCFQCPYGNIVYKPGNGGCVNRCRKDALDLINRQKAENEELRSDKIIAEKHEKDARDLFVDCTKQLEEAKAEIESLKRGVTFTFTIEDFKSIQETVISRLDNKIKSEAIKEFAERLKKSDELYNCIRAIGNVSKIDCLIDTFNNLVKEMMGDRHE